MSRDQRGTIMVETLIAFVPLMLIFLFALQWALIASARIVVQDAASRAARALALSLDDEPCLYGGEARGRLTRSTDKEARLAVVREAMQPALSAVLVPSPHPDPTALTFPVEPGAVGELDLFGPALPHDTVLTARVTRLFSCSLPLVRALLCSRSLDAIPGLEGELRRGGARLSARRRGREDAFVAVRGEASFPYQSAPYLYASQHGQPCSSEKKKPVPRDTARRASAGGASEGRKRR